MYLPNCIFLGIWLLICFPAISPYLLIDFFSYFGITYFSWIYFRFISSSCIVYFTPVFFFFCCFFFFSFQYVPAFILCLIIFAWCRRFLICVSSRNSQLCFEFMLVVLVNPNFFHRLISFPHRQVRLILQCFSLRYVLIIRIFLVLALTVISSWFLVMVI